MRIRTITELIDSTCPDCGEANFGGDTYCRNCGTKLIAGSSVSEGASEEDLNELGMAHKAMIVSKILPAHKLTFDTIKFVIFSPIISILVSMGALTGAIEETDTLKEILICSIALLPIYCGWLYVIAAGPYFDYKSVLHDGSRYPAVVIGHGYAMLHEKSSSNINARSVYPCIKVLTKVFEEDTSIVLFVPGEITEHTCPIGTEITVIGQDDKFVIDPKCRKRLIHDFRMRKAGKTG